MEKYIHIIGIGGIGMSAIAKVLMFNDYQVSGSDLEESFLTRDLAALGAKIAYGHAAENVPPEAQAIAYSTEVKEDNVEMQEAQRRGLAIYRRADMMAFLLSAKYGIGVSGAHGKTTTSAMISTMFENNGWDPTVIVGGTLPVLGGSNAKAGKGQLLVAEADESDGTFLVMRPKVAVVTNVEADHLDYYHTLENLYTAYEQFLRQVPADGFAVVCNDCADLRAMTEKVASTYVTYGIDWPSDYMADSIQQYPGGVAARISYQGEILGDLRLPLVGRHNILNAMASIAVGRRLGLTFRQCADGLASFTGAGRRYEVLADTGTVRIVDDYAHHPTEIAATVDAARGQGVKTLTVIFQPHRVYRTEMLYREFAAALNGADHVILCEVVPGYDEWIPGVDSGLIARELARLGHENVTYVNSLDDAEAYITTHPTGDEEILLMGARIRPLSEKLALYVKENNW